jgi:hypothetical protein
VTLCVRYSCVQVRCMVCGRARIPQAGCRIPYSVVLGGNCNWLHFSAKQINVPSAIMCPEQQAARRNFNGHFHSVRI